ncbi:MAG: GNAT family N-acetyltransferase [Mesorhizobium sp.]|uniref:GNAT family N-acetyltransferase n=1 Tax=Mesorhizobium sp. TaxID=1871066 RepID=UPI001AC8B634|nr:GNAT family N-acetyltransferase [Mesorhizobium sp.]MBN9222468.1 GNAT family N-acetyltransferase [Mesorhizobium sp.]
MTDEVTICELHGLDEMLPAYPVFRQSNSHLNEAVFCERLSAMLAQGNYRCIAAYIGDRLVGLSGFWTGNQLWCGKYIEADHVVVDTSLRSLGIGARLMAWIEAEGERTGCSVFRIAMVLGKHRTHQFYVRNGFFDDGLLMVKALSRGAAEFPEYVSRPAEQGVGA